MGDHGIGDLLEAGDVGTEDVVSLVAELGGGLGGGDKDVLHDPAQACVRVLEGPVVAAGVLLHLEGGGGDAAGVRSLTRSVVDAAVLVNVDGFVGGGHVGALADELHAVFYQEAGMGAGDFVLRCTWKGDVGLEGPDGAVGVEGGAVCFLDVVGDAATADLFDILEEFEVHAVRALDPAGGIGEADDGGAEFLGLLDGVDGDVAGAGDDDLGAVEGGVVALQHFLGEVDEAVAGGLGAHEGATPGQALAGEDACFVAAGEALVLAEQVADLAAADADVAGGDVGVFTDVAEEFRHEGLTKAHDLGVGLALRVEVGATLAAADGQAGEGVFEDLLKAKELDDAKVDGGVEAEATLVRAEGGVELDTEATVDLDLAAVVDPGNAEHDLALRLDEAFDEGVVCVAGVLFQDKLERAQDFLYRLVKLGFSRVSLFDLVVVVGDFFVHITHDVRPFLVAF